MTTIIYKHALETVSNLNADLGLKTGGNIRYNSNATGGTYALINDMIIKLSSIKASIKAEEKVIIKLTYRFSCSRCKY